MDLFVTNGLVKEKSDIQLYFSYYNFQLFGSFGLHKTYQYQLRRKNDLRFRVKHNHLQPCSGFDPMPIGYQLDLQVDLHFQRKMQQVLDLFHLDYNLFRS